jgi:hypothetical protein
MHLSTSPAYKEGPSDARELFCVLWLNEERPKTALARYEERLALCEDTIAPKGKCRVYTLALRPSHVLSAFAAIGRGPKSGKVAQARACHGFPVDSVAFRILSEAALSGATPCRGEQPRASTPRRRPDHYD